MRNIILTIVFLITCVTYAQKPKDTLNTEVIEVVKPYTPTIADAPKINDNPTNATDIIEKQTIEYQIQSVPVASTFTPNKGKAKSIVQPQKERIYNSYITAGMGNYTSPLIDGFLNFIPNNDSEVGISVQHHSARDNNAVDALKKSFSDTYAKIYYQSQTRDVKWKAYFSGLHQMYNWYGLTTAITFDEAFLNQLNTKHQYVGFTVGGDVAYNDSYFTGGNILMSSFSDDYKSSEQRFRLQPQFSFPLGDEMLIVASDLDYLNGKTATDFYNLSVPEYSFFNIGVLPSLKILREGLSLNIGSKLYYAMNTQAGTSQFRAYPDIAAAYRLSGDALNVFGGAKGGLHHNTYQKMVENNPFVSPTFLSVPTDEKYRLYAGINGLLANSIEYQFEASFSDLKNEKIDQLNPIFFPVTDINASKPYTFGNSFAVIYDNAKKYALSGELCFDITENFGIGGDITIEKYDFETEEEWNYPWVESNLFAEYTEKKWDLKANLFIMTDRSDYQYYYTTLPTFAPQEEKEVRVGTYLDLNAHFNYHFSEQLSVFVRGNNLLTTQYQRFYNYPVLGLQVMGGLTYKFD